MKLARQDLPNGELCIIDADGKPLGSEDIDRPTLHLLPKLYVPKEMLTDPFDRLICDQISLNVTSSLSVDILPEGDIEVRQPYPNQRYFVGGSKLTRLGWTITLPPGSTEFDIEFHWFIGNPLLRLFMWADSWEITHLLHVKLLPGEGNTYSMDSVTWPTCGGQSMQLSPITVLGIEDEDQIDRDQRKIIRDGFIGDMKGDQTEDGYFIEEQVDIPGVPHAQVLRIIDAFKEEQLHEVIQTVILSQDIEEHKANAAIEMPADLFVRAVTLAEEIPFHDESEFALSVANIPGGFEHHPAMKLLCDWWDTTRPGGEPFKPGSAMPLVRVRDDGEYWWGSYEIPNVSVKGFNNTGKDVARIGDLMLILFQAVQNSAVFDETGMTVMLPSGSPHSTIGITREQYLAGESDEAWYCLKALASFQRRFPSAWRFLNSEGLNESKN